MTTEQLQAMRERFENQSFVRVLKQANDFHEKQYELLLKLMIKFCESEISFALAQQKEDIVGMIRKKVEDCKSRKRATSFQDTLYNYEKNVLSEIITTIKNLNGSQPTA